MNTIVSGRAGLNGYPMRNAPVRASGTPLRDQCLFSELANRHSDRVVHVMKDALFTIWIGNGQELHMDYDESSTEENPVMKAWGIDSKGMSYEKLIYINEVNPRNASTAEMKALEIHLKQQGDSMLTAPRPTMFGVDFAMQGFDVNEKLDFVQFLNELADKTISPDAVSITRLDADRFKLWFLEHDAESELMNFLEEEV